MRRTAVPPALLLLLLAGPATAVPIQRIPVADTAAWLVRGEDEGPVVVVVGGIHGNEPAGWRAARRIRHWPLRRGTLLVLPRANELGCAAGTREVPGESPFDLNRRFPAEADRSPQGRLATAIWKLLEDHPPDWVVDLHESKDFRTRTTEQAQTLGNTVIAFPDPQTDAVAMKMIAAADGTVAAAEQKWQVLHQPIAGSLARAAAKRLGARAMIVETCRKNHLGIRVRHHRVIVHRLLAELGMLPDGASPWISFPPERREGEARVAVYDDAGAGSGSSFKLERCLPGSGGFTVHRITAPEIRAGALAPYDVALFPGGSGSKLAAALGAEGRERVREFVRGGGGYLGVCAGAYLAVRSYSWSLGILDAEVVDRAHWARGRGDVRVRLTAAGRRQLGEQREEVTVRYGQGPLLRPGGDENLPDFDVLAAYRTEIAKNGAPKGVMKDTPAVVVGRCGKGRVAVIGPHPEDSADGTLRRWIARLVRRLAE